MKKTYFGKKSKKRIALIINGPRKAPENHPISRFRKTLPTSFLYSFEENECIAVSIVPKPTLIRVITIIKRM